MTKTSIGMLLAGGALLAAACGGGTSGTTGAGGSGTATTGTGTTDTSTTATGTGTTTTGTGTSTGTGGGASGLGSPCTTDAMCPGAKCFDETTQGWPGGYCTGDCDPATPDCMGNGTCVDPGDGSGVCLKVCTMGGSQCGAAYDCGDLFGDGSVFACIPNCTTNAQCPVIGTCDTAQGLCIAPEKDCSNVKDDDGDNLIDCEDPSSCQGTPECTPGNVDTGHPCAAAKDCKAMGGDPFCFDEASQGWPKGYCSEFCDLMAKTCVTVGAVCIDAGLPSGGGLCALGCKVAADCPTPGYKCSDLGGGTSVCLPACTLDSQCAMFCNSDDGHCSAMDETCGNTTDDDGDGFVDCEDQDCAMTCVAQVTMACGASVPAVASNMADTTTGSNIFAGSCSGSGSHEKIFSITPGMAGDSGILSLTLASATDQGLYVRSTCGDGASELGCSDAHAGGTDEQLDVDVQGGVPVTIFVDGFSPGEEGPVTLTTSYTSYVTLCGGSVAGNIGANMATTVGGTKSFSGSCTGVGAEERLFTLTPAKSGMLHLVLNSATDQGLYVRSTCADKTTELGCSDENSGGTDEVLDVAVTMGTPVTIYVDGFVPGEAGPFTLTLSLM